MKYSLKAVFPYEKIEEFSDLVEPEEFEEEGSDNLQSQLKV